MGLSQKIRNKAENVFVKAYINSGKRTRKRFDPAIPKIRTTKKTVSTFIKSRSAQGRKDLTKFLKNDIKGLVSSPKKRKKRRKKRR